MTQASALAWLNAHPVWFRNFLGMGHADRLKFRQTHPDFNQMWLEYAGPGGAGNLPPDVSVGGPARPAPAAPAPPAITPAAAASPAANVQDPATTSVGMSARALIQQTLATYGLPATLADWAWGQYIATGNTDQVFLDLRSRPEYAARFPGMKSLRDQGRAMSEGEYISAENTYRSAMRSYGLPTGFYDDPTDFSKLITGGVSGKELDDRLAMAEQTAATDPRGQMLREELTNRYGLPNAPGLVTAFFIDPDKGMDLIKRQYTAAVVGTESRQTGFGSLTNAQAERVGALGVSADQARATFSTLANMNELRANLPGQTTDALGTDELLAAGFEGNTAAQKRIARTQETRAASRSAGGTYAAGQTGISGLGNSSN